MNQAIIEAKKAYVAEIAEKMKNAESTVVASCAQKTLSSRCTRTHWLSVPSKASAPTD